MTTSTPPASEPTEPGQSAPATPVDQPPPTADVEPPAGSSENGASAGGGTVDRARRDPSIDHERFEQADLNKDGVLDADEIRAFRAKNVDSTPEVTRSDPDALPNDPRPHHGDRGPLPWHEFQAGDLPPARYHRWRKVIGRSLSKAWGDSLFGLSSQAAFWSAMSTAPILLALLGFAALVAPLYGSETLGTIHELIQSLLNSVFDAEVADNLVGNTVSTILSNASSDVISVGLLISLWAGSSSMSAFVEAITVAYRQHEYRHPVVERFFALGLYLVALVSGVILLPLLAIGPDYIIQLFPSDLRGTVETAISISYFPVLGIAIVLLLTTLYKVAPKLRHPWKRGLPGAVLATVVFIVASFGLRLYLSYVYSHGLTYGALATPITFLLFYYFAAMAIILGAQMNNALLEYFPMKPNALARVAKVKARETAKEQAREAKRRAKEAAKAEKAAEKEAAHPARPLPA
jgi:membrane protein